MCFQNLGILVCKTQHCGRIVNAEWYVGTEPCERDCGLYVFKKVDEEVLGECEPCKSAREESARVVESLRVFSRRG
jgi:hypothetical protein